MMGKIKVSASSRNPNSAKKWKVSNSGLKAAALGGLLVLAGMSANAQLVHRYSFTTGAGDSVGTANGTLGTGTVSGGKLTTDGTTTGVTLPTTAVAGITGPFAIETWYYANAPQGAYHTAFSFSDGTTAQYLIAQPNRDSGQGWNSSVSIRGGGGTAGEKLMMGFRGTFFPIIPIRLRDSRDRLRRH